MRQSGRNTSARSTGFPLKPSCPNNKKQNDACVVVFDKRTNRRLVVIVEIADISPPVKSFILNRQKADIDKQLANITNAICQGIFNQHTQAKMIELSNTQQALEAQIADEQAKTILPLKEARVVAFLKNYTEIVKCADKAESLDNMKRLFDVFIKEVIFDGERVLIVMKTTNEPLDPEKGQKEEATRKKFELLRFGDPYSVLFE